MATFSFAPAILKVMEIISKFDKTEGRESNKEAELAK